MGSNSGPDDFPPGVLKFIYVKAHIAFHLLLLEKYAGDAFI